MVVNCYERLRLKSTCVEHVFPDGIARAAMHQYAAPGALVGGGAHVDWRKPRSGCLRHLPVFLSTLLAKLGPLLDPLKFDGSLLSAMCFAQRGPQYRAIE